MNRYTTLCQKTSEMDNDIQTAYESLVPADQLVIDAMIVSLYKKDKQIRDMTTEVMKFLSDKQEKAPPQ